jgi:NADPH:quinone reductase-like Zn-dependent oxidoreductase
MKAIQYERYGSPEVLHLKAVDRPTPKDDEVLVRVQAASASPFDWHLMRGAPFLARLSHGLRRPRVPQFGADLSGRVESVGARVTQFHPGEEVFGEHLGSFAEYAVVPEGSLALKPANVSFEAAATVPISGVTALQALRELGHIQPGQKVLINGASGGVGTFAVQIARSFGAEVTGVCGARNLEMVRSIGADHVIDHTQEDFTRNGQRYDLILDAVGNHSISDFRRALTPQGICVVVGFSTMTRLLRVWIGGSLVSRKNGMRIVLKTTPVDQAGLIFMKGLLETGKVVPVIDRRFSLSEVPEAIRYLETGHARGKVVITVGPEEPHRDPGPAPTARILDVPRPLDLSGAPVVPSSRLGSA